MKITTVCRIISISITCLALTMTASADTDGKLFPGALCQPESQTDAIVRFIGTMLNASSNGPQLWTCPIVRDAVDADAIVFARMTVIDNNNDADNEGGPLACSLLSSTRTGGGHDLVGADTTGQGGPGTVTLEFVPAEKTEVAGAASGQYFILCRIPGTDNNGQRSGVVSYEIHERND